MNCSDQSRTNPRSNIKNICVRITKCMKVAETRELKLALYCTKKNNSKTSPSRGG